MPPPHPLRRISTGSLSSLARSQDRQHTSPSGLDFLQPALTELVDEATTLSINISHLNELHDALGTFNESFAGWLYALKINAFCVEWPSAPNEDSFLRSATLVQPEPEPEPISQHTSQNPSPPSPQQHPADQTYATAYSEASEDQPPPKAIAPKKGIVKGKAAIAIKRKRELEIAAIIDTLPLEYRGSQPAQRIGMEKIIAKLMDNPQGLPIADMIAPPELPQPRVNKCLIALVTKKIVSKSSVSGKTWYKWVG